MIISRIRTLNTKRIKQNNLGFLLTRLVTWCERHMFELSDITHSKQQTKIDTLSCAKPKITLIWDWRCVLHATWNELAFINMLFISFTYLMVKFVGFDHAFQITNLNFDTIISNSLPCRQPEMTLKRSWVHASHVI